MKVYNNHYIVDEVFRWLKRLVIDILYINISRWSITLMCTRTRLIEQPNQPVAQPHFFY
eukprot:SAG31_NODE_2032_length_6625_cov_3.010113_6_plen_59_part_00